jgi:O-antigen/teichoic acid export membrane protein
MLLRRAPGALLQHPRFAEWKAARSFGSPASTLTTVFGPFARKVMGLSALTAAGQASFVLALPFLSRLYTPTDFGLFTIYLSIVNLGGPIVGLKFESALYAARNKEEAAATLALSLLTTLITSSAMAVTLFFFGDQLVAQFGPVARPMIWLLPLGLLLSGLWSVSSAWAIKSEAVSTLGAARFGQPAAMTALQLAAALIQPAGGIAMIGAHLLSHLGYTSFIFGKTLTRSDLRTLRLALWNSVLQHAKAQRHFPLFLLPAQVSYLAVSNLPPLLLSSLYGAEIAGHCGIAYRLVAAPLAIASLPLGAIFTGVASRSRDLAVVVPLARKVFLANLLLVCVPILLFGAAAPAIAPAVMGDRWVITGQIIAAFALLGAAHSLAAPFTEITSIFRSQALRFAIEFVSATVVITAIGLGGFNHWSPLKTIWIMSSAGAASSFVGLALVWARLRAMLGRNASHGATADASAARP